MAWYKPDAPAGWGLCNGDKYGDIQSPDLRGRFIKMYTPGMNSGDNPYNVTDTRNTDINTQKRNNNQGVIRYTDFGKTGGSDYKFLDIKEMPSHNHSATRLAYSGDGDPQWESNTKLTGSVAAYIFNDTHATYTNSTGGYDGFGINSPYYTLVYIIYIG